MEENFKNITGLPNNLSQSASIFFTFILTQKYLTLHISQQGFMVYQNVFSLISDLFQRDLSDFLHT